MTWALTTRQRWGGKGEIGNGDFGFHPRSITGARFMDRRHPFGPGGELDLGQGQQGPAGGLPEGRGQGVVEERAAILAQAHLAARAGLDGSRRGSGR